MNAQICSLSGLSLAVATIAATTTIANALNPALAYPTSQPNMPLPVTLQSSELTYTVQPQANILPARLQASPSSTPFVGDEPIDQIPVQAVLPTSPAIIFNPDHTDPANSTPSQTPGYIWPAKGVLSSGFGWRWGRMHQGIDIAAPVGTPIVAAAPGMVVIAAWNNSGYGNLVEIQHADGSLTLYAHNERILVHQGQAVEQGQTIAEMGSSGYSTGPHCHFELHPAGSAAVNPLAYLPTHNGNVGQARSVVGMNP